MGNGVAGTGDQDIDRHTTVLVDVPHLRGCEYRLHP
jgi:hypothetical protein